MLYVGMDGWDGIGWLSQVIGILRAPSLLINADTAKVIDSWDNLSMGWNAIDDQTALGDVR